MTSFPLSPRLLARHSEFLRYKLSPEEFSLVERKVPDKNPRPGAGFKLNIYDWLGCSLPDFFGYRFSSSGELFSFIKGTEKPDLFILDQLKLAFSLPSDVICKLFSRGAYVSSEWKTKTAKQVADNIDRLIGPLICPDSPLLYQLRLLEKLSQFLASKVPAENFNLDNWANGRPSELKLVLTKNSKCPTTGCAVGWMPVAFPEIFVNYKEEVIDGEIPIFMSQNHYEVHRYNIRSVLGISEYAFDHFFMPHSYNFNQKTAQVVAARIAQFVYDKLEGDYGLPKIDWYPAPTLTELLDFNVKASKVLEKSPIVIPNPETPQLEPHGIFYGLVSRIKGRKV